MGRYTDRETQEVEQPRCFNLIKNYRLSMASVEIVDLIQQNLEHEGILSRIREELLSSVINVLNMKNFVETTKIDKFLELENG